MNSYIKIFKALGDETRLRIIKMLEVKKMCVCEIRSIIGSSTPTVSNHLKILKESGLIEQDRSEKYINYSIVKENSKFVEELLGLIKVIETPISISDRDVALRTDRGSISKNVKLTKGELE